MKLDQLNRALFLTFKTISFLGFITAGALTVVFSYFYVYKKYLKNDKVKIDKYRPFFIAVAVLIEAVYLFIYTVLF